MPPNAKKIKPASNDAGRPITHIAMYRVFGGKLLSFVQTLRGFSKLLAIIKGMFLDFFPVDADHHKLTNMYIA
jgi:hypothetical protein